MIKFLDNQATIVDSVELRMFFLESFEVAHSLVSIAKTDDVIDVCYLLRIFFIEAYCSTMDLIDTHVCTHSRKIDESIDCRAIPSFTEDSTSSDDKFGFSLGEFLCD